MRFDPGETWAERRRRLTRPHLWFAWYPVKVKDHDWRWLEYVVRTGTRDHLWHEEWWEWKYEART